MKSEAVYTIIYNIAKIKNQKVICNACKRCYGMPATLLKNRLWHRCFPVSCDYLPKNCLNVFDHFVGLALKGLPFTLRNVCTHFFLQVVQKMMISITVMNCNAFDKIP